MKNIRVELTKRPIIQIITFFSGPILSSNLPRIKQPIIPNKLIKTPRNRISDSFSPKRKEAKHTCKCKYTYHCIVKEKVTKQKP